MKKNRTIPTFLIFLFLLICGNPFTLWAWEERTADHFAVQYHQNSASLAASVLRSLERAYPRVTADIGHTLHRPVYVYIATSDREFQSLTRGALPDWGIGCAFPDSGLIILKAVAEVVSRAELEEVAVHELSHVVLGQALQGKRVPRWFDEGLAMYQSREWNIGQSLIMAKAVFTRSVIPLRSIDRVLQFRRDKAQLAYTQSFLAISYIINEHGLNAFQKIVRTLAQTGDMDRTLHNVIGLHYGEFEAHWFKYVRSKYGWISLFTNSFYLWVGISVLFLLAFLAKRYRTKRTMERWETEDEGFHFENEQDYYDY
ncbi:MAG: peptidase MA family metallohydrolase [bacterium]